MARHKRQKRKYRTRRSGSKLRLKNSTIYSLFFVACIAAGAAMFASYTRSNEFLTSMNLYLTSYFGAFSFLIPIDVILFGLMLTRIKAPFAKANVFLGFSLLTVAFLGLFQSGSVGQQ